MSSIRLARPLIGDAEIEAMVEVVRSGWLVQGARVAAFEEAVAERIGVAHCVAVSSGTAALHLAMLAADFAPGDEVLVPDFTFPATANSVAFSPARPVLVDIDPATFNVSLESLKRAVGPRTRALLAVHQFGYAIPWEVVEFCRDLGLMLLEDAACALGSAWTTEEGLSFCGAVGQIGCFSLHPRKVITTGEGGLVTTQDAALAARLRRLRNHGMERGPSGLRFVEPGLNYRLSEFQAAMGSVQMGRLDAIIEDRRRIARGYRARFEGIGLGLPPADEVRHIYQSYVVMLPEGVDRDAVMAGLRADGVECTLGTHACSGTESFRDARRAPGGLPGSEAAFRRSLSLPVATGLTDAELDRVAERLRHHLGAAA